MSSLIKEISKIFPARPDYAPRRHYVYGIYVSGKLRYVGKGKDWRAWSHWSMITQLLEAAIRGGDLADALFFHRMCVRELAGKYGDKTKFEVKVFVDNLSKEEAYMRESRMIGALPLYLADDPGKDEGLWNIGGRGLSVGARISQAESDYKDGINTKAARKNRRRPGKNKRQNLKYAFGNGFGCNDRVILPATSTEWSDDKLN